MPRPAPPPTTVSGAGPKPRPYRSLAPAPRHGHRGGPWGRAGGLDPVPHVSRLQPVSAPARPRGVAIRAPCVPCALAPARACPGQRGATSRGLRRPPLGPSAGRRGADLGSKIAEKTENVSLLTYTIAGDPGGGTPAIRPPEGVYWDHETPICENLSQKKYFFARKF